MEDIKEYFQIEKTLQNHQKEKSVRTFIIKLFSVSSFKLTDLCPKSTTMYDKELYNIFSKFELIELIIFSAACA